MRMRQGELADFSLIVFIDGRTRPVYSPKTRTGGLTFLLSTNLTWYLSARFLRVHSMGGFPDGVVQMLYRRFRHNADTETKDSEKCPKPHKYMRPGTD